MNRISVLVWALLAAGSLLHVPGASATTPNTINIDGNCADWAADEKFPGNDSTELWTTWDSTRLYFAWWGGGASTQRRIATIDLNPGVADTSSTLTYSGVAFPARGQADYIVEFNNLQVWFTYRTGSTYTTVINPPGTANFFNAGGCAGVNFAEVSVPRNLFTTGSLTGISTTQTMAVSGWFFNQGTNFVFGGCPAGFNGSGTANQNFTHGIVFPTTDGGRAPNTYGVTSNQVPVTLSRWGLED